jgi:uncharacterized membrane protein YfcA
MQGSLPTDSNTARNALYLALGIVTLGYLIMLYRALRARAAAGDRIRPGLPISVISFIANFFDTLGIGSYATTTSMLRPGKLVPDQLLPATLNVGYVIPTVIQAYYYNKTVPVDSTTLVVMIGASVIGAWLGAPIVAAMPRRKIQIGMGVSLLLFVVIAIMGQPQIGLLPTGGDALALTGGKLAFAAVANFTLGALMTLGIGLYGPCMILIYMLGMRPTAAFPIMMGSCAFLMPLASVRFLRTQAYEPKAILAMLLPGIPAVLIAATMVTNFPKNVVSWLVVVVVTYTAVNLLRAARREKDIASVATIAETQPAGD